ncbi:MAG: divalent cation tolerance protein CutA [Proteobacteria bacterium]|nr:divalent cation tolerance protein CutA [Pseudomonadota bacterium]
MKKVILVETTYPNLSSAKKLAKILLDQNLAACVQFFEIKSMYVWQKKIQNDQEILVRIKTKNSLYKQVEILIKKHHSYKIPQIFSIQINQGSKTYCDWVVKSTKISSK